MKNEFMLSELKFVVDKAKRERDNHFCATRTKTFPHTAKLFGYFVFLFFNVIFLVVSLNKNDYLSFFLLSQLQTLIQTT